MQADPRKPLAPLDASVIEHLTQRYGPPREFLATIVGNRDIYATAWIVAEHTITATGDAARGTTVTIRLTPGGSLVTTRLTFRPGSEEQTGAAHATPAGALDWLLADGKGKLGPASKEAWKQACQNVPPMAEFAVERVA